MVGGAFKSMVISMFWEASLIPVFFLINQWGGPARAAASLNYVLYTMVGSAFLLVALAVLYMVSPGHSFDMASLAGASARLSLPTQLGLLAPESRPAAASRASARSAP